MAEGLNGKLIKQNSIPIPALSGVTGTNKYVGTDELGNQGVFDKTTFDNGLTLSGNTAELGGVLNKDTEINTDGNELTIKIITKENILNYPLSQGFNSGVKTIAIQSDGKIIVGGFFTTYNGSGANRIIRLNTDGTIDSSFIIGTGFNTDVNTIAIQSDGKIIVGGYFITYNGSGANRIIRLNTDGTIDSSFTIGTGFDDYVSAITIQPDGKIIVGGYFITYNGSGANRIIRLNTDGTIDSSFTIGTGFDDYVSAITIQPDGKIVVGGNFSTYNGSSANYIIRLNTDGTIDSSFTIGTGFNSEVSTIAIQSDGKIVVGGNFSTYNGSSANYIIRLNTDGTIDSSFTIGTGFDDYVSAITIQPDGKIIIGGVFGGYNGSLSLQLIRLNTDGTIDSSFTIGTGFNSGVSTIAIQPDSKIIAGGGFTTYQTFSYDRFIILSENGSVYSTIDDISNVFFNEGLVNYENNYHSKYINRTLVDKEYVDSSITAKIDNYLTLSGATDGMALIYNSGSTKYEPSFYDYNDLVNIPTSSQYGNTLFISKDGNDTSGLKGRLDKPYLTIQSAINEAISNDTIIIYEGTYTENVIINNKNLTFIGTGKVVLSGNYNITNSVIEFDNIKLYYNSGDNITSTTSTITIKNCEMQCSSTQHCSNTGTSSISVRNSIGNKNLTNLTFTNESYFMFVTKTDFII